MRDGIWDRGRERGWERRVEWRRGPCISILVGTKHKVAVPLLYYLVDFRNGSHRKRGKKEAGSRVWKLIVHFHRVVRWCVYPMPCAWMPPKLHLPPLPHPLPDKLTQLLRPKLVYFAPATKEKLQLWGTGEPKTRRQTFKTDVETDYLQLPFSQTIIRVCVSIRRSVASSSSSCYEERIILKNGNCCPG